MADIISLQELADAKLDAQSLERFINGGVDEEVLTRLSQQYPTIKKLLLEFQKYNGRAYKTYAEMDADKANLSSKTKVTVTNDATASNNGDWQWDGVAFTKSAYDPISQSKELILGSSTVTNAKARFFETIKDAATKFLTEQSFHQAYIADDISHVELSEEQEISDLSALNISSDSYLTLKSLVATDATPIFDLKLNSGEGKIESALSILPSDSINNGVLTRYITKTPYSALTNILVVEQIGGFRRIQASAGASYLYGNIDKCNIVDLSKTFVAATQANITSQTVDAISSHQSGAIQFWVSDATLTKAGYLNTSAAAVEFVADISQQIPLRFRLATPESIKCEQFRNLKLATGVYTFIYPYNISSCLFGLSPIRGKSRKTILGGAYDTLSTSITNTTDEQYDGWCELKVEFERGQVFTNDQLQVRDNPGNEITAQFAPDLHQNLRKLKTEGYYSDGSFKSGSLWIQNSLNSGETKSFNLRIFEEVIRTQVKHFDISTISSGTTISFAGLDLIFRPVGQGYPLKEIVKDGVIHPIGLRNAIYASKISDATSIASIELILKDIPKIGNYGDNFIDIEFVTYNPLFGDHNLLSGDIEVYNLLRVFSDGVIKSKAIFRATREIPATVLYGAYVGISSSGYTSPQQSFTKSTSKRFFKSLVNATHSTAFLFEHHYGDIHRDGTAYGPTRPVQYYESISTGAWDIRAGWRDSLASTSSINWPIKKNWAWVVDLTMMIDSTLSTADDACNYLFNKPTGLLSKQSHIFRKKSRFLRNLEFYSLDLLDWYNSSYGVNPSGSHMFRAYSSELLRIIRGGDGDFSELVDSFIAMVRARSGVSDLDSVGSAFTNGNTNRFAMQFDSRVISPHSLFLYLYAVRIGDTARAEDLRKIIVSYATAMTGHVNTYGSLNQSGALTANGASNMAASGMRFISQAIYIGADTDGSMRTAFNTMNSFFNYAVSGTWVGVKNYILDTQTEIYANSRYLHYAMYTVNHYLHSCMLVGVEPNFDVSQLALNAYNANGQPREIEWCISESRRGGRNTLSFTLSGLSFYDRDGTWNLAERVLRNLQDDFDIKTDGYYAREYDYESITSGGTSNQVTTEAGFVLASIQDIVLSDYFKI